MRKLFILFVVAILLTLASCSSKSNGSGNEVELDEEALKNVNEEGMPIVEEPIDLKFFAGKSPATADNWNDVMIFNKYEEKTNMNIEWEMVPHASLEEKRNLALASGSLPDAFHSSSMPIADIMKYGQQGVFIPLNDLIEEYAPNFKGILDEYPEIEKAITFPDGNIYSFPLLAEPDFLSYRMGPKPWINEEWLDALDMDMPETTEDYYEYLKAVKEGDPNGNGKNDEIPYGGPGIESLITYLNGAFGVSNMGSSNANVDLDPETKDMRFYPITDGYKEMLQYINKLYSEGLIEQNIFTIESDQYHANAMDGKYGSTSWYSPVDIFGDEAGDAFTGMPALEGPNGDGMFTTLYPAALNPGAFLITKDNENPAATVRWVDYFYGDEGLLEYFMGFEGETYELNDDGEPEYMDHILNSEEGLTYEQELSKYLTFPGGGFPSMTTQEYFKGAESSPKAMEAADKLEADLPEDPWPAFIYLKEERSQLDSFGADIEKYVEEMRDKFISGDASFDEWDKYVKTIEGMNLDKYLEIKTDAYERFQEN